MLNALLLAIAIVPQAGPAGDPVVQPAKIEIAVPQLDRERGIKAIMPFEHKVKRYEFDLKLDKLDGTQTRSLFVNVLNNMWDAGGANFRTNSQRWIFNSVLDDNGEKYSIEYVATAWDSVYSFGTDTQLTKEQFTLRYKSQPKPVSVPAVSAERSLSEGLYRTHESVRFDVTPEQLLQMADGGLLRIVYGDRNVELDMDASDVEALRWFVWEKVKGGKDLMRARYTIVEKPKAQPAAAPKSDAAKDKPAEKPKIEQPKRAA